MRPKQNIYIILPSHSANSHHLNMRGQGRKPEETHQPVSSSWTPPQLYEGSTDAMAPALLHLPQHQQPVLGQVLVLPPALKPHHLPHRLNILGLRPLLHRVFPAAHRLSNEGEEELLGARLPALPALREGLGPPPSNLTSRTSGCFYKAWIC